MPLNRLPSSSPTTTRLRKPMSTGPTHSLESLMDNMPDNSKKATKLSAKIQKKQAAARTKSIRSSAPEARGPRPELSEVCGRPLPI